MRAVRGSLRSPAVQILAIAHAVFFAAAALWSVGFFESSELAFYDALVSMRAGSHAGGEPIVIVGANDRDLDRFGWPLPDEALATLLETLESSGSAAIGIDLYRDNPRGEGAEHLARVLKSNRNIIGVFKLSSHDEPGIGPPVALAGTNRIGFADMVTDTNGVVRRGLLLAEDGGRTYQSLAFRVAREYLGARNIRPRSVPNDPDKLEVGRSTLSAFSGSQGGYVRADAGGFQILLDYLGGPKPFRRYTIADIVDGKVDPQLLRDKVVLIGVAANSVKDLFFTPFGGGASMIFGTELQGHVAAQILRAAERGLAPPRGVSLAAAMALIWFGAMAGTLSARALRSGTAVAIAGAVAVLAFALAGYGGLYGGVWLPAVGPAAATLGGMLGQAFLLWDQERAQRARLMRLFSQNVSSAIAEDLWRRRDEFAPGGEPRPQRLTATVLFIDIRGFTGAAEAMSPEDVLGWLNGYLSALVDVVIRHDGVINKFIGDAIMAVFGVPIPRTSEDDIAADAGKAVHCALAMADALEGLNARWLAEGMPLMRTRIGINTGPLVAGSVGNEKRLEYTVIGDAVNVASRLESFNKELGKDLSCRILVSGSTMKFVEGQVQADAVGPLELSGKGDRIMGYLVRCADRMEEGDAKHA